MTTDQQVKTGYDATKDAIINLLKGKELSSIKVLLEEMGEELHLDGLYFVTYQDFETLLVASKSIETIVFDMGKADNYDIIVAKMNGEIGYFLNVDRRNNERNFLNLIKVLQSVLDIKLETTFPSSPFTIKVAGEAMPAILFSKNDLK